MSGHDDPSGLVNSTLLNSCGQAASGVLFSEPRICQQGGSGQVLPLTESEINWDPKLRVILYGAGLIYCFLGVSIVADLFMAAIERITSRKKILKLDNKRLLTTIAWNKTVANLTLMALGSSAPEILLSLNDVVKRGFHNGKLGAATIVGSAAFNLFVIIAVCINSVPNGEVRMIKETGVFIITAIFSVFAYGWLLWIVNFNSPNIIEVSEGAMTFAFFPVLVTTSFLADIGVLSKQGMRNLFNLIAAKLSGGTGEDSDDEYECSVCGVLCWSLDILCSCSTFLICFVPRSIRRCIQARRERYARALEDEQEDLEHRAGAFDPEEPIKDENGVEIDNEWGILTFKGDALDVTVGDTEQECTIPVYRKNGTTGRISVKYKMEALTAVPEYDFVESEGELNYRDGISEQEIKVTILPKIAAHLNDRFQLILEETSGGALLNPLSDGGEEQCILTVTIINENPGDRRLCARLTRWWDSVVNIEETRLGGATWRSQIKEAFYVKGSREEQDNAGPSEWITHMIWFPWHMLFAILTPPVNYVGGWFCFWSSLLHIGWLTILVGDLAELFGCVVEIDDGITAITFVALGTSVPDLFASRTAAMTEEWADASIVNVTGSNSVNIFLGIGLPWALAAIFWDVNGADDDWRMRYPDFCHLDGAFIVDSGGLAFSVTVFTLAAVTCLVLIIVRRHVFGGELGGPPDAKAYSSFFLILLWLFYIGLSTWQISTKNDVIVTQFVVIALSVPAIGLLMIIFGLLLQLLKFSKQYIGEEGFWGIFVATSIIGGRMLIFFGFQYEW